MNRNDLIDAAESLDRLLLQLDEIGCVCPRRGEHRPGCWSVRNAAEVVRVRALIDRLHKRIMAPKRRT